FPICQPAPQSYFLKSLAMAQLPLLLALTLVLTMTLAVATDDTADVVATNCTSVQYYDIVTKACVNYSSPQAKAAADLDARVDTGNTAWILTSSALVMVMTPGVAFFYAGLAGDSMASNTIMMAFVSMAVVSIQFFAFGYSVCFSEGLFQWTAFNAIGSAVSGVYGSKIPAMLHALYQTQFAMITPALRSGGIVGRMKFGTFILFTILWSSIVYTPLARWMWSSYLNSDYELGPYGWEAKMGSLDFAGGTVIHISSGFGALVAAIVVGKRYNHGESVRPHNVPLVMIGATLLWFGWFGFNAGSSGAADGIAAIAAINTHLAGCAGFLTWIAMERFIHQKIDPCGAASGAMAGLVAITPGCGYVYPWASLIFGVVGAITAFACVHLKNLVSASYSVVVTSLILMALKYTHREISGMDVCYHGGNAYGGSPPTKAAANPSLDNFGAMATPMLGLETSSNNSTRVSDAADNV
ncbi:TPA: hypothetical protein N0F65_008116, partial [Lagenidium giganteum]